MVRPLVCCVPGYGAPTSSLRVLRAAFHAAGFDTAAVSWPWWDVRKDLESVSERTTAELDRVVGRADQPVVLCGHSMGGVLCLQAATQLAPSSALTGVVVVAAPVAGTAWASVALGPTRAAHRLSVSPCPVPVLAVVASRDRVVPKGSAAPAGLAAEVLYLDATHTSVVLHPAHCGRIARSTKRFLDPAH
jgi:predicted alpha/beta hydrolase family esterase